MGANVLVFVFSHPKYYKIYVFYSLWLNLTSEERRETVSSKVNAVGSA